MALCPAQRHRWSWLGSSFSACGLCRAPSVIMGVCEITSSCGRVSSAWPAICHSAGTLGFGFLAVLDWLTPEGSHAIRGTAPGFPAVQIDNVTFEVAHLREYEGEHAARYSRSDFVGTPVLLQPHGRLDRSDRNAQREKIERLVRFTIQINKTLRRRARRRGQRNESDEIEEKRFLHRAATQRF